MRLMECGFTDQLNRLVNESIVKRVEGGESIENIKFDELYTDIAQTARGKCYVY